MYRRRKDDGERKKMLREIVNVVTVAESERIVVKKLEGERRLIYKEVVNQENSSYTRHSNPFE